MKPEQTEYYNDRIESAIIFDQQEVINEKQNSLSNIYTEEVRNINFNIE